MSFRSTASRALPSNLPPPSRSRPSSPRASSTPPPPTSRDKRALYIASLFGFSFALYLSFIYVGIKKDWQRSQQLLESGSLSKDGDVCNRWDTIGRNYDDEIELAEKVMFMGRKRKQLVSRARGQVLEVSVGTGRNMGYYDLHSWGRAGEREYHEGRVTGLVFNDKADVMVEKARRKFEELERKKSKAQRFRGRAEFVVGDVRDEGVVERTEVLSGGGFDTVVQTMGLCSTSDPVGFLKRLRELCRKPTAKAKAKAIATASTGQREDQVAEGKYGKEILKNVDEEDYDGGRILLLEHGRGYYDWLNNVLDGLAPSHADHYGCWWNRDIGAIVEQSGLEVESIKRYHLGTTWEVVLRPRSEEEVPAEAESGIQESKSSGLFGWISKVLK